MTVIFIRTIIVYVLLMAALKLMGKRQIGEVQVSEFVITLLISELAAYPVMNSGIPLSYAVIPIVTLISAEVITSFLGMKFRGFKSLLEPSPCILIDKGRIRQDNLKNVRYTVEELISEVRLKGISDISEVEYAILESNGQLSVFEKPEFQTVKAVQMQIAPEAAGVAHPVVVDGKINEPSLKAAGRDSRFVYDRLGEKRLAIGNVFLMTIDDAGKITIVLTEDAA
ncbi:DUF421 domain-containing protein [Clostridia bacterium]|nr:DUF421 domain-containing protein [Clostridia bacterium]